jgi:CysZ protein
MDLLLGLRYNLRGFAFAMKTPKLLILGLLRFVVFIFITILAAGLILLYHNEIMDLIWTRPESKWVVWLWYVLSWLVTLLLVGVSAVLSYLVSQILFSVIIMDQMSRITETKIRGMVVEPAKVTPLNFFFYLVRQEIPRAVIPILLAMLLVLVGWLSPLGPVITVVGSAVAIVFLSWDNTDIVPARRFIPFRARFRFLRQTLSFHLGFGLPFLIPGLNILLLAFAPVGATLYYLERQENRDKRVAGKPSLPR